MTRSRIQNKKVVIGDDTVHYPDGAMTMDYQGKQGSTLWNYIPQLGSEVGVSMGTKPPRKRPE